MRTKDLFARKHRLDLEAGSISVASFGSCSVASLRVTVAGEFKDVGVVSQHRNLRHHITEQNIFDSAISARAGKVSEYSKVSLIRTPTDKDVPCLKSVDGNDSNLAHSPSRTRTVRNVA